MIGKYLRLVLTYGCILGLGLTFGHFAPQFYQSLKPQYVEGDFRSFYDGSTEVAVYGTPTCPYCAKARAFLRDRHIQFSDFDITNNAKARQSFANLGSQSVPVILVGRRRINGFNAPAITAALEVAGQHTSK
jgi:mycoredoxin